MSDYIHFYNHEDGTTYAQKLIAFFPNEGKVIFEGYSKVPKDKLPSRQLIYRNYPNTNYTALYDVEITAVSRKDVHAPPRPPKKEGADASEEEHHCDPDECGCCISFFPSDLVILSFRVLKRDTDLPSIDWNYCIDGRFSSPAELIERYEKLLELPEDRYVSYDSCDEDAPFYTGFHEMMKRAEDTYASQFVQPEKKMICKLLKQWRELYRASTGAKNKAFFSKFCKLLRFLEENMGAMSLWCGEYALKMTLEEKLRGWLTFGIKEVKREGRRLAPVDFDKDWKLFFRVEGGVADLVHFGEDAFDISYPHYLKLLKQMKAKSDFGKCDDATILAIHEGKSCNGGFICGMCDDMECMWEMKVKEEFLQMNNIFINSACGEKFIEKWLDAVSSIDEAGKDRIQFCWPPIRPYYVAGNEYLSVDECISNLIKEREIRYYRYRVRPKVEFEWVLDLKTSFREYGLPESVYKEGPNQYNEFYLFLSHILPILPYMISIDKKRLDEVRERYMCLPDE